MKPFFSEMWVSLRIIFTLSILFLAACTTDTSREGNTHSEPAETNSVIAVGETITPTNGFTSLPQPTLTEESLRTKIPLVEVSENTFLNPAGCKKPSDDYSIITEDHWTLNQRTYEMLEYAAALYQGEIDLTGYAITQGSYSNAEPHSFGTHSGGGAVDISVMREGTYTVLYSEIYELVQALRTAGFAAWFRDFDEVYPGSPVHIHAIAIGDEQLSDAAAEQLTGEAGYFKGFSGLFDEYGNPGTDRFGGPILCDWMVADYEGLINIEKKDYPSLETATQNYLPGNKTTYLLNYYSNSDHQHWYKLVNSDIARELLSASGLLPFPLMVDFTGKSFLEQFKEFVSEEQTWYQVFSYEQPFHSINKETINWTPGDILVFPESIMDETVCGFENIFLISGISENGNPLSLGIYREAGNFIISEIDLFSNENCLQTGISGYGGFIIYHRLSSRTLKENYAYQVMPGDTLSSVSEKYFCDIPAIIAANQLTTKDLEIGQMLLIPADRPEE